MSELIRLRELPGIQSIAELCLNPRNFEYPTLSYTSEKINAVSVGLFGITEYDTYEDELDEDDEPEEDAGEYEQQYAVASLPWPQGETFWTFIGWDISDGKGQELICSHFFARQIIAVARELVDGAKFTPDGSGIAAYDFDGSLVEPEERWEQALQRQAERFLQEKGKGS